MKKYIIILMAFFLVSCHSVNEKTTELNVEINTNQSIEEGTSDVSDEVMTDSSEEVDDRPSSQTVEIGVQNLNVRDAFTGGNKIIGQLHKGSSVFIQGKHYDGDGKLWYEIDYEDQKGFIASWFTIDIGNDRVHRVHDKDNILRGFYKIDGFEINEATHRIHLIDDKLHLEYETLLDHEKVYLLLNSDKATKVDYLKQDIELIYGDISVLLKSDEIAEFEIIEEMHQMILKTVSRDQEILFRLLMEDNIILLGEKYQILDEGKTLVYLENTEANRVMSYDLLTNEIEEVKIQETTNSYSVNNGLVVNVVFDMPVTTITIDEDQWELYYDSDKAIVLYSIDVNKVVEEEKIILDEPLSIRPTNMFYIKESTVYQMYDTHYNGEKLIIMKQLSEEVWTRILGEDCLLYFDEEIKVVKNVRHIKVKSIGSSQNNILLAFNNKESFRYEYSDEMKYYMIGGVQKKISELGNTISFSNTDSYFASANALDDHHLENITLYNSKTLEAIHTIEDISYFGAEYLLDKAWKEDILTITLERKGQEEWFDINNIYLKSVEFFNPITGESEAMHQARSESVEVDVYDQPLSGQLLGRKSLQTDDLDFMNLVSYEGSHIILWFKHETGGYVKRVMSEDETMSVSLVEPLMFVSQDGTEFEFQNAYDQLELNSEVFYNHLDITFRADTGDDHYLLLNLKKGYQIPVGWSYSFSPNGAYLATEFDSNIYNYLETQIWQLPELNKVFQHKYDEPGPEELTISYRDLKWLNDTTLTCTYSNNKEGLSDVERLLVKEGDQWTLRLGD